MDTRYILGIAVALVMGWFAAGLIYNLRRGDAVLRWLQKALPRVGEKTTLRWLGTSVVQLGIAHAKAPFRSLDTLVVLAPRDLPWTWGLAALQGRQDTLILRASLAQAPALDFDLVEPKAWTGRMALKQASSLDWKAQPGPAPDGHEPAMRMEADSKRYPLDGMQLWAPMGTLPRAAAARRELENPAGRLSSHYFRFSIRRQPPHLEVHMPLPDRHADAVEFITAFQELAQAAEHLAH